MKNKILILAMLGVFSANFIHSDEVEEVVVQASILNVTEDNIGDPLHILSGTDVSDLGTTSLGETLDSLLGVTTSDYGSAVGQPIIRGLSGSRVKVLTNGLVNRDVAGIGADHKNEVDLNDIQQIEVVRGPSSLLYANGATGGIVNIVDNTIATSNVEKRLFKLGFEPTKSGDGWNCITPSWRHDIEGEADLVEEVLRIYGFDKIPTNQLDFGNILPTPAVNTSQERRSFVRRFLALRGLTEAVTFSFLSEELASMFGGGKADLKLVNPISSDLSVMRPNVVANLLSALGRNSDRGQGNGALFEVGPQFQGTAPGDQSIVASGVRIGKVNEHSWLEESRNIDIFDVKADLLETLTAIEININNLSISRDTPSYYHPGRSGSIKMGPKNIVGFFGEIHPSILSNMGFRSRAVAFELFLDNIPLPKTGKGFTKEFLELSPYQAVERDFAFTVDIDRDSDQIVSAIRAVDKKLIKEVLVFDLFVDGTIGKNKKSIGIRVQLQPLEATFSDKEIDDISQKIVDSIREKVGGELRK